MENTKVLKIGATVTFLLDRLYDFRKSRPILFIYLPAQMLDEHSRLGPAVIHLNVGRLYPAADLFFLS
jgi:hypothetical protein